MICINTGDCFLNTAYPNRVLYLQEEAALVDCGALGEALFPVIRVGGCRAADVLPGGLVLVRCGTQRNGRSLQMLASHVQIISDTNSYI